MRHGGKREWEWTHLYKYLLDTDLNIQILHFVTFEIPPPLEHQLQRTGPVTPSIYYSIFTPPPPYTSPSYPSSSSYFFYSFFFPFFFLFFFFSFFAFSVDRKET